MDGWNTFSFPFGARLIFRGELLVSESVVSGCMLCFRSFVVRRRHQMRLAHARNLRELEACGFLARSDFFGGKLPPGTSPKGKLIQGLYKPIQSNWLFRVYWG